MFGYFTSLFLISVFSQIIMLYILSADNLLYKVNKNYFKLTFLLMLIITTLEWIWVYLIRQGFVYSFFDDLITYIIFTFSPIVPIFLSLSFKKFKSIKIILIVLIFNFLIQLLIFTDYFYISFDNMFYLKNLLIVYEITFIICSFYAYENIILMCKAYQSKKTYVLTLTFIVILVSIFMEMFNGEIYITWMTGTSSTIILYSYYCSLINKLDPLTHLLNRRCFNNKIKSIKNNCIILYLDLNNFKEINDTYGHIYGDIILKEISKIINITFSKYGSCYRTGGDEFCIILEKNTLITDILIDKFNNNIILQRVNSPLLPNVAVGYSLFDKNKKTIEKALEEADTMMYANKSINKN